MEKDSTTPKTGMVPCCPELVTEPVCDVLDFHYRLVHNTVVVVNDQRQNVSVEVILHFRLERCPGPFALGDLVYTQTLFPGEKVRLFTSDRRSRFTFDSSSKVSYRNEQTQEEQFYLSSMSDFMSDVSVRDSSRATNRASGSARGHAETSGAIESFFAGPSVDVSGSYNSESTSEFLREINQHARASHHASEQGTRAASSVSVGEVQSRTHTETESQDHFESSSREFANPNHCHAVTFYFYRINKMQTIRLKLEAIRRRVIDPAADTRITNNTFTSNGDVSTIPAGVLATSKDRLDIERVARTSAQFRAERQDFAVGQAPSRGGFAAANRFTLEPMSAEVRQRALEQVDKGLVSNGLIREVGGEVSKEAKAQFSFEVRSTLPTPGLIVKGCLDDCDICEPEVKRAIELDLERKSLENEKLKREIELMDKDQQHRCCPEAPAPEA